MSVAAAVSPSQGGHRGLHPARHAWHPAQAAPVARQPGLLPACGAPPREDRKRDHAELDEQHRTQRDGGARKHRQEG